MDGNIAMARVIFTQTLTGMTTPDLEVAMAFGELEVALGHIGNMAVQLNESAVEESLPAAPEFWTNRSISKAILISNFLKLALLRSVLRPLRSK